MSSAPPPAAPPASAAPAPGGAPRAAIHVAGSDRPERSEVRIGFMPLTDCASIVMAPVLGFDRRHGVTIVPTRATSWAGLRDRLVGGELQMAHALYGLVVGTELGLGGPQCDMAVLMTLNRNGQGLTLSRRLAARGAVDAASLAALMAAQPRPYTFAQTFPTGTHAMWLYYWLAAAGIDPFGGARVVTVPPPQMVAAMRGGAVDGFSVGEPWNHRAILDGVGVGVATSQQVWPDHPEKVLGATAAFVARHPNTARAVTMAVLEASRWIDASPANRARTAATLAGAAYVDTPLDAIEPRLQGRYDDGHGGVRDDPHALRFCADGAVNFPYLSDAIWFMTQFRRWGLAREHPDYLGVARRLQRVALYREAAAGVGLDVPHAPMRTSRLIDGTVWDGSDPAAYADGFAVHARADRRVASPAAA